MYKSLFLLFLLILLLITYKSEYFSYPIDEIVISSKNKKYNERSINTYIETLYDKNLLTIDIDDVQATIISDKWIRDAEITKSFPSTLSIQIIQHIPIATYNSNIITSTGALIKSSDPYENLPNIIDYSNDLQSANHILSLSHKNLEKINLIIQKIVIYHSLIKIYTSDVLLITDKEKFEINLMRLSASFEKINDIYDKKITSIDMRYSNGFAIK
tara:strand:+ start:731 stop:1375 length:645 start_codon:yes stop_codon:yes gene_type:complete